jgi:hypothetical protein
MGRQMRYIVRNWICGIVGGALLVLPGTIDDWRVAKRRRVFVETANRYLADAKAESSPLTTYQNAKQWLEDRGFQVVTNGPNWICERPTGNTSSGISSYHAVVGFKTLGWESTLHGDHTIQVSFVFDNNDIYINTEMADDRGPLPRWRRVSSK